MRENDDEPTRSDLKLERQALNQHWGVSPEIRRTILQRLVDYLDRECEEGATASDRTILMAARTFALFMRLDLGQQALDLAREKIDGAKSEVSLADLVAAAEARAEDRRRERAATVGDGRERQGTPP